MLPDQECRERLAVLEEFCRMARAGDEGCAAVFTFFNRPDGRPGLLTIRYAHGSISIDVRVEGGPQGGLV